MNVEAALRNIVLILQQDPRKYRRFGAWWWTVKRMLKGEYGPEQLFLLGDYVDAAAPEMPELTPEGALREALIEFAMNDRYNLGRAECEAPDGDTYVLVDQDAGGI